MSVRLIATFDWIRMVVHGSVRYLWFGLFFTLGCLRLPAQPVISSPTEAEQTAAATITDSVLRSHIRFLADDLLEGRGPGSRGDALAQKYIATQFQGLGLQPASPTGGWVQPVPLVGVTTTNPRELLFHHGEQSLRLDYYSDYILNSGKPLTKIQIDQAPIVFVGYGIQAPEYQWDDFKDVDLKGKVLLMMNNDPEDDPNLFAGKRRLYYGRWDYKFASAARQGAVGAIIIHTKESAGYPYQVVQTSWSGEEFELSEQEGPHVDMRGWLSEEAAKKLVNLAGKNLDDLRKAAQSREFRPIPLEIPFSVDLKCDVRVQETGNVLGLLPGSDPDLDDQMMVFMAHHDHLGLAAARDAKGDNIYNGAVDNAAGSASLLAIAQAVARLPERPRRSILFAAVGAEEQGLLGSQYMAAHPPAPSGKLAAVVNIDGINILGRTKDVNVIGLGKSDMDRFVEGFANWQHRVVTPDQFPDRGSYYRSDQFSLAKIGVPGVYLHCGIHVIGKPEGWGRQQLEQWVEQTYHQPSDEYRDDWDLSGAVEDVRLLFYVGVRAANTTAMPAWTPGDEFESARK